MNRAAFSAPDVPPWPADFAARYRAAGYWRDRPLGHWLWASADSHGERIAIVDGEHRITYRELAESADSLAEALHSAGLRPGDNIIVQLPNGWEFVTLLLGCFRAGVVPVLTLLPHRRHELSHLAHLTDARMIAVPDRRRGFDHQALAEELRDSLGRNCPVAVAGEARPGNLDLRALMRPAGRAPDRRQRLDRTAPAADSIALFLLSGGTTGMPKLIGRTHNDYEYAFRRMGEIIGVGPDTTYLVTLPAAHNFPLGGPGILGTLAAGGRNVLLPSPEPAAARAAIAREAPTVTSLVPAIAQRWVEAAESGGWDVNSLEVIQLGGSVLDPALAGRIRPVLGGRIQQVFGMAEGLLNCTRPGDTDEVTFSTQGRPVSPGDEIRIVGADGTPVPHGEVGELLTRGPYTPRGYYRAPEHNAQRFTRDGWYRTGDLVRWHPSGNLVVTGRSKDLVNRGGEKISTAEVEVLARKLLDVHDAAALPVPDPRLGEAVCLVVVPVEGRPVPGPDELRARFLEYGVAHYKIPGRVEMVEELPLTPVGKVDKTSLRAEIAARGPATGHR